MQVIFDVYKMVSNLEYKINIFIKQYYIIILKIKLTLFWTQPSLLMPEYVTVEYRSPL